MEPPFDSEADDELSPEDEAWVIEFLADCAEGWE